MAEKPESITNKAWNGAFEKYNILERVKNDGYADITADQMRVFREPRLMSKVDHSQNLPQAFKENKLSILTLSTSEFRIGHFDIFQSLPEWKLPGNEVETLPFPPNLETLDFTNLTGEPGVINTAYATEMLHTFCEQELVLTVSGRMRTSDFTYSVNTTQGEPQSIRVNRAQMEIDAAYEGDKNFFIFEVKNHMARDFNLRQLYYPYRTWQDRIKKKTNPVFLTFSNDVFDLYEYGFETITDFSSASLVKHKRYMLTHTQPKVEQLVESAKRGAAAKGKTTRSSTTTFPQADDFERIVDLVAYLLEAPRTTDDLTSNYDFDPRQSDYYFNAAKYLGLSTIQETEDGTAYLVATDEAAKIFAMPYQEKYSALADLVLGIQTVANLYLELLKTGSKPSPSHAEELFANSPDSRGLSGTTLRRRATTALSWANWAYQISK
jgi:hypothetical protein